MKANYECSACKRSNVKLWRPYGYPSPLICASCAEQRQSPFEYEEMSYEKAENGNYIGTPTGRKIAGQKWVVDETGYVPSYHGPGPSELKLPLTMTDQLIVDISDIDTSYASGKTTMIPAVPNDDGQFWCYNAVPKDKIAWWEALPTR